MTDPMTRIADALERIAPPLPEPADPHAHPAYLWDGTALVAARAFAPLPIDLIQGLAAHKATLRDNLDRLARGVAAQDTLLWGARGTGKSALVKASIGALQTEGADLALVEVTGALDTLPGLFAAIAGTGRAFAVFIDDIGFEGVMESRALRSLLEGGAEARPANARLIVTANRRHLIPRDMADQQSAINPRDSADDQLALADRFGLSLGFHAIDQDAYLAIVAGYAKAYGLDFEPAEATRWATQRGSRSGRVAWQYIVDLAGRSGHTLA